MALFGEEDPLPSWAEGEVKERIKTFVTKVTDKSSKSYVCPNERVAIFDLDGTLIVEWPINFQRALAIDFLKHKVLKNPYLKKEQPYKAVCEGDELFYNKKTNHSYVFLEAFKGVTQTAYDAYVKNFLANSLHPFWNVPTQKLFYKPSVELLRYLANNQFEVYVCSTTEEGCIRILLEKAFGLHPYQVIGNEVEKAVKITEAHTIEFRFGDTFRKPENRSEYKCLYIHDEIGKQPIFVFGNSMGDCAMCKMASSLKHASKLVLILDHDDSEREISYHDIDLLKTAKAFGWAVVSMRKDFKTIFDEGVSPKGKKQVVLVSRYL